MKLFSKYFKKNSDPPSPKASERAGKKNNSSGKDIPDNVVITENKKKNNNKLKSSKIFTKKRVIVILSVVLLLISLFGISVFAFELAYKDKVYPRVWLDGLSVGGRTKDEVTSILKARLEYYSKNNVMITYKDQKWSPSLEEIGSSLDVEGTVNRAFSVGRDKSFIISFFDQVKTLTRSQNIEAKFELTEDVLNKYIEGIQAKVNQPPQNATLAFQGGAWVVVPPKDGSGVTISEMSKEIKGSLNTLSPKTIEIKPHKLEPAITEDGIGEAKKKANIFTTSPINFTYAGEVYVADQAQIASWVDFIAAKDYPHELDAQLNDGRITAFFTENISSKIDNPPIKTKYTMAADGQKIILSQGEDGEGVDVPAAIAQIKVLVEKSGTREIPLSVTVIKAGEVESTPYGVVALTNEKYVDVSLSAQVLTCFDGGKAQFSSLVSTGISRYPTPTGNFHIYSKTPSCRMQHFYGPGNPDNYDLPNVPWAMFFTGPYSLHGTYWHSNFGTPMSHGCVNLPTPAAGWVYAWAPIGTLVIVHY